MPTESAFAGQKTNNPGMRAAVSNYNRSGHCYSFEEIEAIHRREVVTARLRQSKLAA